MRAVVLSAAGKTRFGGTAEAELGLVSSTLRKLFLQALPKTSSTVNNINSFFISYNFST
jgi:hypothetical protein